MGRGNRKFVRVCPKCGSSDVSKDLSLVALLGGGGGFECRNCGYKGQFFPEVEEEGLKEFREEVKGRDKERR